MQNPQGSTTVDILAAIGIILAVTLVIVVFVNPVRELKREYDQQRVEDLRDLTEILLELRERDPHRFEEIVAGLGAERTMVGTADSCAGSYGIQCSDAVLNDKCIDLSVDAIPDFVNELPVDPSGGIFSDERTGYYLSKLNDNLVIAACNPQLQSNIEIVADLDERAP